MGLLAWQDHAVVAVYLAGVLGIGLWCSRKQTNEEEYFLGGRRLPWFAVGMSIIASLLSSLTYISEPAEVWKSGTSHLLGKMLAIPVEMLIVWVFIIPFLMRFRITSAYDYLDLRFGAAVRRFAVVLFLLTVVTWMGFIVLASSRVIADLSGMPLPAVLATVGLATTFYTVLGGLRAVVWTDVTQVLVLFGGALYVVGWVAWTTGSGLGDWHAALAASNVKSFQWFSANPMERATVLTVAINMCVWHVCTHTANQMTVQRYFATSDLRAARRSFVTGSILGVLINGLLGVVGLAVFFYYQMPEHPLPTTLDPVRGADKIFPHFFTHEMAPGVAGLILAALLAAAMSSIDSGINSMATVLLVEWHRQRNRQGGDADRVAGAKWLTVALGLWVTGMAYGLDFLPKDRNIVEMMPRTFNAFVPPLAAPFFIGMFLPRAGAACALAASLVGLATTVTLSFAREWGLLAALGLEGDLSFTWIMPTALALSLAVAWFVSRIEPAPPYGPGLTWADRHRTPTP